jgi:hypothetical protein
LGGSPLILFKANNKKSPRPLWDEGFHSRGATQISLAPVLTKKPTSDATGFPFLAALKASLTLSDTSRGFPDDIFYPDNGGSPAQATKKYSVRPATPRSIRHPGAGETLSSAHSLSRHLGCVLLLITVLFNSISTKIFIHLADGFVKLPFGNLDDR